MVWQEVIVYSVSLGVSLTLIRFVNSRNETLCCTNRVCFRIEALCCMFGIPFSTLKCRSVGYTYTQRQPSIHIYADVQQPNRTRTPQILLPGPHSYPSVLIATKLSRAPHARAHVPHPINGNVSKPTGREKNSYNIVKLRYLISKSILICIHMYHNTSASS